MGFSTGLAGCGQTPPKPPSAIDIAPITQEDNSLKRDESSLFTARGALQRERKQIVDERQELAEKRKAVQPSDRAAAAALADQEVALMKKENDLVQKESELSKKLDVLLTQRAQLVQKATLQVAAAPGATSDERAAGREQSVAGREKDLARREAELAAREQAMALRERDLAKREKETCGVAPTTTTTTPKQEAPRGLKYTQHDVEPVYEKALRSMQHLGLLASDLPGRGRLVDETRAAMQAGDYVRAKYAADQLLDEVQGTQIDRAFVQGKMARVSDAMKGKPVEGEAHKLMQEAITAYSDGKFSLANQKINRLFSLLK